MPKSYDQPCPYGAFGIGLSVFCLPALLDYVFHAFSCSLDGVPSFFPSPFSDDPPFSVDLRLLLFPNLPAVGYCFSEEEHLPPFFATCLPFTMHAVPLSPSSLFARVSRLCQTSNLMEGYSLPPLETVFTSSQLVSRSSSIPFFGTVFFLIPPPFPHLELPPSFFTAICMADSPPPLLLCPGLSSFIYVFRL